MEQIEKAIEGITRDEWIRFRWVEIPPSMGDEDERMFRTAGRRTADEAYQSMMEWDETAEERGGEPEQEKDPTNAEFCAACCIMYSGKVPPEKPPCESCGGWLARQERGPIQ